MSPPVTIIVPVYRGAHEVRECLASVIRHRGEVPARLVVIDDASPEPEVSAYLDEFSRTDQPVPVTLLRNDENLGFVRTVNRGLVLAEGDAVILNADTIVTARWLDKLSAVATEPDVATVTPLTNFGSICTMPTSIIDAFDLESDKPAIDACADFVERNTVEARPEVITGVGFCMYVTRAALDLCGLLDEETFGAGYGEEVDFCLRATRVGLRHLVDDSTFVFHHGAVSFGDEREEGMARGSSLLHDRYRFFRAANRRERSENPLELSFTSLELGLNERRPGRPHVLHLLHSPPGALGGTEKHLRSLMEAMLDQIDFSILYPIESGFVLRTLWNLGSAVPLEQEFLLPGAPRRITKIHDDVAAVGLQTALDLFEFDAVHLQNIIGHSLAPLDVLADFDGPVLCSVRDMYLACPNHWLMYRNERACGVPDDLSVCATCLGETRRVEIDYLEQFRATVADRIDAVDHWVFASQSAADYLLRVYDIPDDRIELITHGATVDLDRASRTLGQAAIFDEPLRVAMVGLGWAKKGLDVVNRLADEFRGSSIEIHHFGPLKQEASPAVHAHGPYDNDVLPELLQAAGIHIVLLPGAYAETFGHVMTESIVAGIPVIAASYGALGERIRAQGTGWTIDPEDFTQIRDLVQDLDRCREEVWRATERTLDVYLESVAETAPRYAKLYRAVDVDNPSGAVEDQV
jgi:GT2 family glycosyltransferase/glycosyltransferase involved in cell wall biosynthesis